MNYEELVKYAEKLTYRDKFRLVQLLVQLARKEEEEQNPEKRTATTANVASDPELIQYVAERLRRLKPVKRDSTLNSIGAMFQFQGGISDIDKQKIFDELVRIGDIKVIASNRVEVRAQREA